MDFTLAPDVDAVRRPVSAFLSGHVPALEFWSWG